MMRCPIKEEDFPKVTHKVAEKKVKGRDVYGFFLEEGEFQKIAKDEFLSDGYLGPMGFKTDAICCMASADSSSLSEEYLQQIERGEFIVGSKPEDTIKKIVKHNLSVREIKIWHRLGWSFKT